MKFTAEPGIDIDFVKSSAVFTGWFNRLDPRFIVHSIHFQSVDMFGKRLGFVKFKANVTDPTGREIPGIVFMRGSSVAILPVLICDSVEYVALTVQPRFPSAEFEKEELPAGMSDGEGNLNLVAAKEFKQELGITISEDELFDLSEAAGHPDGYLLSPGGCDERIRLFSFTRTVTKSELDAINGRETGEIKENEKIKVVVKPINDVYALDDAKSVLALALYRLHGPKSA